jgi:hypothetical protein
MASRTWYLQRSEFVVDFTFVVVKVPEFRPLQMEGHAKFLSLFGSLSGCSRACHLCRVPKHKRGNNIIKEEVLERVVCISNCQGKCGCSRD